VSGWSFADLTLARESFCLAEILPRERRFEAVAHQLSYFNAIQNAFV
jgi:hypothetical protein